MGVGRVNPGGWPTGAKLTSAQANQLDINVSDESDRLDDVDADLQTSKEAVICKLTPSASALADAGTLSIAVHLGYPSGDWNVTSDQVQVPSAGIYRVSLNMRVTVASTSNPDAAVVHCRIGASGIIKWFVGERFSATNTVAFGVTGETIVYIATPASEKIWLRNESGSDLSVVDPGGGDAVYMNEFIIERIGDAA